MTDELRCIEANLEYGAGLLDVMGNPKRLLVLCALVRAEYSVGDLADLVGLSQSALSQHLAKLRDAKLVTTRRVAQTVYYSCSAPCVILLLAVLAQIYSQRGPIGVQAGQSHR